MKKAWPIILMLLCLTFLSFHSEKSYKVLFIGNSLTYTNSLPELVKKVAKKKGMKIQTEMVAFPNYALIDHWEDGKVQKFISEKDFDLVILQQGPSSQEFGKEILIAYGKKFGELCKKHNTQMAYFMVWPSREYYHTFKGVIKNHKEAAEINQAILFPVGEVWKKHFDNTGKFDYYGPDQFHPSEKGSQIAAEVIVDGMLNIRNNQ